MVTISSLAETGALLGEPARTAMLVTLMDGRALTAGELARVAGVAPPTATGHLSRLVEAGLLSVSTQGRHRYFRLGSPSVARMIESMMGVAALAGAAYTARPIVTGPASQAMRRARVCYDHLAGEVAVRIADSLAASGHIDLTDEGAAVTDKGIAFLAALGLEFGQDRPDQRGKNQQRPFCRACMDWSERRPHLAGAVGRSLLQLFLARHWLRRVDGSRAITVTQAGTAALERHFGFGVIEAPDFIEERV